MQFHICSKRNKKNTWRWYGEKKKQKRDYCSTADRYTYTPIIYNTAYILCACDKPRWELGDVSLNCRFLRRGVRGRARALALARSRDRWTRRFVCARLLSLSCYCFVAARAINYCYTLLPNLFSRVQELYLMSETATKTCQGERSNKKKNTGRSYLYDLTIAYPAHECRCKAEKDAIKNNETKKTQDDETKVFRILCFCSLIIESTTQGDLDRDVCIVCVYNGPFILAGVTMLTYWRVPNCRECKVTFWCWEYNSTSILSVENNDNSLWWFDKERESGGTIRCKLLRDRHCST